MDFIICSFGGANQVHFKLIDMSLRLRGVGHRKSQDVFCLRGLVVYGILSSSFCDLCRSIEWTLRRCKSLVTALSLFAYCQWRRLKWGCFDNFINRCVFLLEYALLIFINNNNINV